MTDMPETWARATLSVADLPSNRGMLVELYQGFRVRGIIQSVYYRQGRYYVMFQPGSVFKQDGYLWRSTSEWSGSGGAPDFYVDQKNSFDVLQILGGKSWPGALLHPEWYDSAPEVNEAEETLQLFLIEQLHERLPGWSTASRVKAANAFINILKDLKE